MYLPATKSASVSAFVKGKQHNAVSFGKIIAAGALSVLFVPFFILILWKLVHNWGWWRVKPEKGDRQYVKTWHVWMDQDKYDQRLRSRGNRNIFGCNVTTAHLVWISWTPEGAKTQHTLQKPHGTFLQRLPRWLGLHKIDIRGAGRSTDVEMGTIPEPPTIRITDASAVNTVRWQDCPRPISLEQVDGPAEAGSLTTSRVMSGALRNSEGLDNGDTVRRRRSSTEHSPVWQANSSETSRATVTQFIMPTHDFRIPIWADRLFGNGASQHTMTSLSSQTPSSNQPQAHLPSHAPDKLSDKPLDQASIAARRAVRSSPASAPPLAIPALAGLRSSTTLSAVIDLDNLSTYLESGSRYGCYGSLTSGRTIPLEALGPLPSPTIARSQSLTQRLKARARPSIVGLFPIFRRRSSKGSKPDWPDVEPVAAEDTLECAGDALQEYENEGSLDDAIPFQRSTQASMSSTAHTPKASLRESNSTLRAVAQAGLESFRDSSCTYRPLNSITNLPTATGSTASRPYSSVSKEPHFDSISLRKRVSRTTSGPTDPTTPKLRARKLAIRSSLIPSVSLLEPVTTPIPHLQTPPRSVAEKAVQHELRQRLQWLDLRCTLKGKGFELDVLSEDDEPLAAPAGIDEGLKSRRNLRRVGHFKPGWQQGGPRAATGKENANLHACGSFAGRESNKVSMSGTSRVDLFLSVADFCRVDWVMVIGLCISNWSTKR